MQLATIILLLLGLNTWGVGIVGDTNHPEQKRWEIIGLIGFPLLMCGIVGLCVTYARL